MKPSISHLQLLGRKCFIHIPKEQCLPRSKLMLHLSLQDMILFEAFHCKKPSISHLQPFGRKCFIHIPKERHLPRSKLMPRAEEGIFLGYTDTPSIYKVHIPAHSYTFIVSALDVKFESGTADCRPGTGVTMSDVTMSDVTMLDVNLGHGPTTATSISYVRPITCSMTDSQQPPQQSFQPP